MARGHAPLRTFVATKNSGKLVELRALFARSPLALEIYPGYAEVDEGESDYAENALLKARGLAAQLRAGGVAGFALADDSGIEVDALGGRPGVLSARYAGLGTPWPARLDRLLGEVRGLSDERRGARFVCALALVAPDGGERIARGEVAGRLVDAVRGSGGFGYDPIFVHLADGRTFAELSFEEKNAVSHRGRAAVALIDLLRDGDV